MIHATAEVHPSARIGPDTKIWHHVHVMPGATIGARCVLGQNCFVAASACIGDGCRIQNNVSLYDGVTLEEEVFVGPSAVFTNVSRPRAGFLKGAASFEKTVIRKGATIGANATIVCGVIVGQGAFVGAGAVVTRDVLPYSVVLGVPARFHGWICACGASLSEPELTCSACGRVYRATETEGLSLTDALSTDATA